MNNIQQGMVLRQLSLLSWSMMSRGAVVVTGCRLDKRVDGPDVQIGTVNEIQLEDGGGAKYNITFSNHVRMFVDLSKAIVVRESAVVWKNC